MYSLSVFITANVFRFRDAGRACSGDNYPSEFSDYFPAWYSLGLFIWRWIVATYVLVSVICVASCVLIYFMEKKMNEKYARTSHEIEEEPMAE